MAGWLPCTGSGSRRSRGRSPGQPSRTARRAAFSPTVAWTCCGLVAISSSPGPTRSSFLSVHPSGARYAGLRFAPGLGPSVVRGPCARRARRAGPARRAVGASRGAASRGAGRGGAERGRRVGDGRGPPRPGPGSWSTRRSPTSFAAPAVAIGSQRSRRRSGCRHASCSAGPSTPFGYGPKLLARILRLGDALALARRGVPLAAVAAQCGYADQAHLANDVRSLAGTTLGQLGLGARPQPSGAAAGRAANRSTGLPSGSRTVA